MEELRIRLGSRVKDSDMFRQFCECLPQSFDEMGREVHHGRNVIKTVNADNLGVAGLSSVTVKRYHGLFFFQRIYYSKCRFPKCRRAFDNTAELRRRGIDAAEELALIEVWSRGIFKYGLFVSETVAGERLDDLVIRLQGEGQDMVVAQIIRAFAAFVYQVHRQGVVYMDMNCGNVMCRQEGDGWHFTLIDTNRAHFYEPGVLPDMETCMPDLILVNPAMGTVEQFIGEYLRVRGRYNEAEVKRIREIQRMRHERRNPVITFLKRHNSLYYRWLN